MRQYIVNLTNHFIGKNRYDKVFNKIGNPDEFVQHVKFDLDSGDVRTMNPDTLGRIMCSFEIGDVMASKKDLFNGVSFGGDCEEMLRELVSLCLAYAIRDRLDDRCPTDIPRWEKRTSFRSSVKKVSGETVGELIRRIVEDHFNHDPHRYSASEILRDVCRELNVSPDDIRDNVADAILKIGKERDNVPLS